MAGGGSHRATQWEGLRRRNDSGEVLLEEVDESVGGRVVRGDVRVILQLRLDLLGQLLPQFHPVASGGGTGEGN